MFGLSKFANRNKIETEERDTQNICECKCRRNLHSAYVCYYSLFPVWQIDTRMNYRSDYGQLRN